MKTNTTTTAPNYDLATTFDEHEIRVTFAGSGEGKRLVNTVQPVLLSAGNALITYDHSGSASLTVDIRRARDKKSIYWPTTRRILQDKGRQIGKAIAAEIDRVLGELAAGSPPPAPVAAPAPNPAPVEPPAATPTPAPAPLAVLAPSETRKGATVRLTGEQIAAILAACEDAYNTDAVPGDLLSALEILRFGPVAKGKTAKLPTGTPAQVEELALLMRSVATFDLIVKLYGPAGALATAVQVRVPETGIFRRISWQNLDAGSLVAACNELNRIANAIEKTSTATERASVIAHYLGR